jgi:hypothetical protein
LAALIAVLSAIGKVVRREMRTLSSVTLNNFFLVAALLAYGALASKMPPLASAPFFLLLGLFLLFPAAGDPYGKIPPTRLALWPLSNYQRAALHLASFAFSPIAWLALLIAILLGAKTTVAFLGLMVCIGGLRFLGFQVSNRWSHFYRQGLPPALPTTTGKLIRLNFRQMFCLLDFYLAIAVCIVGTSYRLLSRHPDPAAFPIFAILVGLATSTYAQSLFGLDGPGGLTLYRVLPIRGWRILLAKDAAYMAVVCLLTLPLDLTVGLTFGMVALAIGRYPSLVRQKDQRRWLFASGDVRFGAAQIFFASGIAFAESQEGVRFLAIAFLVYAIALATGGWYWDTRKVWLGSEN